MHGGLRGPRHSDVPQMWRVKTTPKERDPPSSLRWLRHGIMLRHLQASPVLSSASSTTRMLEPQLAHCTSRNSILES